MANRPKYITDPSTFNQEWKRLVTLRDEIKKRLNEVSGLIKILEDNSGLPDEVQDNLTELKNEASSLQTLLTNSQTYAQSIENYYTTWSSTKDKIDSELEEAQEQNKTLEEYVEHANKLKTKLTNELKRSSSLLDDARKTLTLATDGALATVFIRRSDERREERVKWIYAVMGAVLAFVVALVVIVLFVAKDLSNQNAVSVWVLKLALIVPFAYVVYFVTKQYTRERDLEEKYAFKSLISQTIQNNTKLLKDEFVEEETDREVELKIIDFTVESLKSVYKEPFSESSLESRLRFNPRKTILEAEAKQTEKG